MDQICVLFVIALFTNVAFGQNAQRPETDDNLDDRYGFGLPNWFPGQNQLPGQNQFLGQNQRTTTPRSNTVSTTIASTGPTTMSPVVRQCISQCPVTPEYNPVCGTDSVTYTNAGRLNCAQACGVNVSLLRTSPCPPPQPAADATVQQ